MNVIGADASTSPVPERRSSIAHEFGPPVSQSTPKGCVMPGQGSPLPAIGLSSCMTPTTGIVNAYGAPAGAAGTNTLVFAVRLSAAMRRDDDADGPTGAERAADPDVLARRRQPGGGRDGEGVGCRRRGPEHQQPNSCQAERGGDDRAEPDTSVSIGSLHFHGWTHEMLLRLGHAVDRTTRSSRDPMGRARIAGTPPFVQAKARYATHKFVPRYRPDADEPEQDEQQGFSRPTPARDCLHRSLSQNRFCAAP